MIHHSIKVTTLSLCLLFLFACNEQSNEGLEQMNYELEFPTETSPALEEFITHYTTANEGVFLLEQDDSSVFARTNYNADATSVDYFSIKKQQVEESVTSLLHSDNVKKGFTEMTENDLMQEIDATNDDILPEIEWNKDNNLNITTRFGTKEYSLPETLKEFDLQPTDELIINGYALNKDEFGIAIENLERDDQNGFMFLFIKQDFSKLYATSSFEDPFHESIKSGKLKDFEQLIYQASPSDDTWKILHDHYGMLDINDQTITTVAETDLQSKDELFVYLKGNEEPLKEGKQRIQKIEDYVAGNDEYAATFELNYEQISDALELDSVNDVSIGKITYFNEDFVVLFLEFKAAITGEAGSTNVIIDFQKDRENPKMYLVDLGIH